MVDAQGRKVDYRYDLVGNRTHLVDHDGAETVWGYDELNRNVSIDVPGQGTTAQTHTKAGKLESIVRPDGSTSAYAYDDAGRIASIAHTKAGETIAGYAYRYDLNGNRVEQKETNGATTNGEVTTTYRYDDADRLDRVIEPARTTDYTLDAVGNRTLETVEANGETVSRSVLGYNARDQLTSRDDAIANVHVVQTYDANGNLKTQTSNGVGRTYDYDARDRLIRLQEGTNAPLTFDYDAQGMRLAKSQGTQTTKYQYDQTSLLAETNAIGNTLSRYHYSATQLIGETKAGPTLRQRHYLLDALRSPIALLTQQGVVDARTRYDAWGEVISQQGTSGSVVAPARDGANANLATTDEQPVGFTGYIKDSESGLYYAKARYYDAAVARFTTEDPAHGADLEPPSLHRYLYAYANPTVYVDRSGRCTTELTCRMMAYQFAPPEEKSRGLQAISPNAARVAGGAMAVAETAESLVVGPVVAAATLGQSVAEQTGLISGYEATDRLGSAVDGVVRTGQEIGEVGPWRYAVNKTSDRFTAIDEAGKRGDYFDQGNLVVDTGITAASLAVGGGGLVRVGKSAARSIKEAVERSKAFTVVESATKTDDARSQALGQIDLPSSDEPTAGLLHPGKLAAESDAVSRESVLRALRRSNSTEGAAAAKLLKRGIVDVEFSDELLAMPAGGVMPFNSNRMTIYRNYAGTPSQAAGLAAHESEHYLQHLTPMQYRVGIKALEAEVAAYRVQRAVDRGYYLQSDSEVVDFLVDSPLYPQINRRAAEEFWRNGGQYVRRLK